MEEKSKLFYDDLVGSGYKLPDYETFKTSLQDQSKADAFYKDLSSSGFKLPDFDTFYGVFKPADTTQVALQPVVEQPTKEAQSTLSNVLGSVNQAFYGVPGDILELTAMGSALAERGLAKLGVPGADPNIGAEDVNILGMKSLNPMRASKEWKEAIANASPVDQEFKESFVGGVSQGFGQLFSMLASGGSSAAPQIAKMSLKTGTNLTPVIAAWKELVGNAITKPGLIGGATNAAASYHQAKQEGATEEEALQFGIENFGVGLVFENLPIQKMLSRVAKIDPNSTMITRMVKGGAQAFTEEFLTEELQSLYSDMSAQRIYDENRKLLEDIGYEGTVGGTVGFLANTMLTALAGRRAKIKSPEEAEVLDKAIEETETVVNKIDSKNKKIEETVTALENTKSRTLNNGATDLEFIENPDGSIELSEDGLTAPDAESKKLLLEAKYPNVEFQVVDNTDKKDPYAESNFTIVGRPKSNAKYSKGKEVLSKNQTEFLIEGATNLNELEGLNIENDADLQSALEAKVKELTPDQEVGSGPTISNMSGESVTVRVGDQNISGIVEVDEGGKATITQGDAVYEIPQDAKFTEFVRPVEVSPEGDFVVNGDSFQEARIVVENGKPKALLIRSDGTTKAITNPRVVEEIEYQITLSQLDQMSDQEADQILESYEQQRQTEAVAKEGTAESNETEDDRKLREATEEIQLIEDLALLELEDIESQAKLVEFTPPSMKEPKIYLVKKNPNGSYTASLNGRKVARPEIVAELGKLFEQKSGEDVSKLQEQTNKLKQEVEQKLFPNATPPKQQAIAEPAGEGLSTPKAVSQKPANQGIDTEVPVVEDVPEQIEQESEGAPVDEEAVAEEAVAEEPTIEEVKVVPVGIIPEKGDRISFTLFGEAMTGTKKGDNIVGDDGTIYRPSMVKDVAPIANESKIDISKKKIKALKSSLKTQISSDKQGVIVDFEARAKDDIKFFNTLRNLVIEYARLKGLQFNEFVTDVQKLLGQEIDKKNREYLKSVWDAEKKATPRKNVMTENKSMPYKDQVKQGIAELVASKNRELKIKLERERAKADERVKEAKDKGKEALAQFENIKNTMVELLKMDLKDIPVDSFTKGELNKILTQINKARTDWSLNLAIGKAYDILGEAGKKKRISVAKEKVSQAKKNIKAGKIGVLQPNSPLDQMLRINPKIIPQRIFDEYESILGEVGARKTVLSPSERSVLFRRVSEVMKEVDKDNSLLNSLKYEYDNFEDKGETYSETLTKMLKSDIISEEEMEFMKLRKSEIQEKNEAEKTEPSQEELDEVIDSILNEIPNLPQPGNNFSKDENKIIRFFNSLKDSDLQGLKLKDLSSIYSLMGNLENNYVPHLAEKLRQRIEGIRNAKVIQPITKGFKGKWSDILSRTKAGIKNKFMQDETTSMRERIRMNPLAYIDQSLRNFKNTLFYDSTFRKLASAYSSFDSDFKTVLEKLLKAESGLKNQFESRSKMMMMAVQEEFESNPDAKVHSAKDWLDATVADKYSIYTAESKRKLQELFDSLSTNGEFDLKKAEKSLSKEEKDARKAIDEINNYLTPIADWTATVIRGNRVPIHENYIHLPRKVKGGQPVNFDPKTMGGPLNPSTKSGALIERTGKTHAISFDVFDNVLSGAKQTLLDYHLTPVVREMNQTFSQLESMAENESEVEAAIQMSKIYEESLKNTVGVSMAEENLPDAIFNEVARKGYQAILSGVGKSISEFTSNSIFAGMFKLDATTNGIKILSNLKPDKSSAVVKNVGSTHSSRLYNTSGMDSKHTEFAGYNTKKLAKVSGVDESVVSRLVNVAKDNKWYRTVDSIQSTLMSSPDQVVARPLWMGVFNQAFVRETNQDPDFDKIAANDQEYMDQYSEAIDIARNEADDTVTEAVASANPFDGILKNTQAPGGSAIGKYVNTFNSFMTRFAVYEYNSAVRGVNALVGNGKMSKADGAKLLGALTVRLMFYDLMTETLLGLIYQSIAGLFSDQKEEEREDLGDILSRSFVSSMIMLTLNRNMGNVAKTPINYAVELANKEFGEGTTYTGEYDPFTSSVVYPLIPVEMEPGSKGIPQMLVENTSASMMPLTKTAFRTMTVAHRAATSKTDEAKERNMKELMTRTPIEIAGNLGYIPFYKDVRKVLLNYWYNAEEQIDKEVGEDKESKRKFGER